MARDFVFSPFNNFFSYLNSKKHLKNEVEKLKEENKKLQTENLTVDILRNENSDLKNLLGLYEGKQDYKLAKVILATPFAPYDTLIINLGQDQVKEGQSVYWGAIMLGKIANVYENTALVKLISAPDQKIVVRINDEYEAEAFGIGNLAFRASLPKDLNIQKGYVVSVKNNDIDAIIGPVQDIVSNDTSTFQDVYFSVPLKMSDINYVEVKN